MQRQKEYGCDARQKEDGTWENPGYSGLSLEPGVITWGCPRRPVKDSPLYWHEFLTVYRMFKAGVMPDEGSMAQQSAKGIKMLTVFDGAISRFESEKLDNARRKAGG